MAITPYRSADTFDTLFDSLMGRGGMTRNSSLMRAPETDVVETEQDIRVMVEMPGLRQDDIEVDVENNLLTVRGEKREEREEGEEGKYHLSERRYGTFARSFVLPRDVEADDISASFKDGVLTVHIPKSERARPRRIEVGSSEAPARVEGSAEQSEARKDDE